MSHPMNDQYLERMDEKFGDALDIGDYVTASSILAEVRNNGFTQSAVVMNKVLLEQPVINFMNVTSPYA